MRPGSSSIPPPRRTPESNRWARPDADGGCRVGRLVDSLVDQALAAHPELAQGTARLAAAREAEAGVRYGPLFPTVSVLAFVGGLGGGRRGQPAAFGASQDYLLSLGWRVGRAVSSTPPDGPPRGRATEKPGCWPRSDARRSCGRWWRRPPGSARSRTGSPPPGGPLRRRGDAPPEPAEAGVRGGGGARAHPGRAGLDPSPHGLPDRRRSSSNVSAWRSDPK
jgi:hypothetical protein